jgi:hypothetical protein
MSFLTLRVLLFATECAAASLLLPLLAYAVTRLLRRAALRHLAWLAMFGVLALLPAAALLLPANRIVLRAEMAAAPPVPVLAAPVTVVPLLPEPILEFRAPAPVPAPASPPILTLENGLLLLAALWTLGFAWNLGRMLLGAAGLQRLRRGSEAFSAPSVSCEVRISREVSGPATFGFVRPLVLLPWAARAWSDVRLAAVLAHEAAHVRRHDIAGQALARLVCAIWWFNPLLWLGLRALRREAELAADDAVLAGGMTPSDYAAALVALVAEIPPHRLHAFSAGMAEPPLLARVQSVLAENLSRKGVTRMDLARTLSLGLAATLLLGAARFDLVQAQEAPAAQPAPSVEIERKVDRNIEVRTDAIKARADAVAAEAKARAEAEPDAVKRARERQEDAKAAAQSAALKAEADERAASARQYLAQNRQQASEAQLRAREAEKRALEDRAKADEAQRRGRETLAQDASADRVQPFAEGSASGPFAPGTSTARAFAPSADAPRAGSRVLTTRDGARTLTTTGQEAPRDLSAEEQRLNALAEQTAMAEQTLAAAQRQLAQAREQVEAARRNLNDALRQRMQNPAK